MSTSLFTFNLRAQNSKNGADNEHRSTQSSVILFYNPTTLNTLTYPLRRRFVYSLP